MADMVVVVVVMAVASCPDLSKVAVKPVATR